MSRTKFPYLTEAIKRAPIVELPRVDGKGVYRFNAYPFAESGGDLSHQLVREIRDGLTKYVRMYFPDPNLIVGIDNEGYVWASMLAYDLWKNSTKFWSIEQYNPDFIRALTDTFPERYGFVKVSSPFERETLRYNRDAFTQGDKVLVVDDVISEGNTLDAVLNVLINELYVNVVGAQVILAKSDSYKRVEDKWGVPIRFLKKVKT